MSTELNYTRKWNGVLGLTITDLETGVVRALLKPTNAVIEDNPDVQKIVGSDALGRDTNIGSVINGFKPVLTLTYPGANLDLYAMQRGRKVLTGTFNDLVLPKEMQVTKASYAGATTGKVGFGIAADAVAFASTQDENLETVELTQEAFATFDGATPNSFAIGANFARKFSDDLVARRAFVQIEVPMATATSARNLSEESLGPQKINMLVKASNDNVTLVKIPNAIVDPSGSRLDPKAENIEVKFDLSGLGVCEPYSVYELAQTIYCDK